VKVGKPTSTRVPRRRFDPEQLVLWKPRGGKRRGAGRKPKGRRAGSPHKTRPELNPRHPVHVVLRVIGAVGNLRRRFTYRAIREATLTIARREDFRIVHLSIQRTHVHLLVEADDKATLALGMQGFQISAAKHLNAAISKGKPGPRRCGTVFPDRYHAQIITSPRQARHALSYVLVNRPVGPRTTTRVSWAFLFSAPRTVTARCAVTTLLKGGSASACAASERGARRVHRDRAQRWGSGDEPASDTSM
jgi:REP element-mobilizing transposase RayT